VTHEHPEAAEYAAAAPELEARASNVVTFVGNGTAPCAKVNKLREIVDGREVWCDWCYVHSHWLNGDHGVTRTAADELVDGVQP
jgi:hypothetical protein